MPNALNYLSFTFLKSIVDAILYVLWCMRHDKKYPVHKIRRVCRVVSV
jgi:hypothetical protein